MKTVSGQGRGSCWCENRSIIREICRSSGKVHLEAGFVMIGLQDKHDTKAKIKGGEERCQSLLYR